VKSGAGEIRSEFTFQLGARHRLQRAAAIFASSTNQVILRGHRNPPPQPRPAPPQPKPEPAQSTNQVIPRGNRNPPPPPPQSRPEPPQSANHVISRPT